MKKFFVLSVVSIIAFGSIGCASIIHGTNQKIGISSSPDNASIVVYDSRDRVVVEQTTPSIVKLKRGGGYFKGATYRIEITKSGYETQTVRISSSMNGGSYLVGNFFLGGILGWVIIDPMTGGMWTLKPKSIDSQLHQSLGGTDAEMDEGIYVILKEQIPEDIFNTLELVEIN